MLLEDPKIGLCVALMRTGPTYSGHSVSTASNSAFSQAAVIVPFKRLIGLVNTAPHVAPLQRNTGWHQGICQAVRSACVQFLRAHECPKFVWGAS